MRRTKQRRLNVDYKRRRIILDACKPNPACAFYTPIRLSGRRHNPSLHLQRRTSYGPTPLIIIGPGRRNRLWSPPRRQPPPHWLYPCLVSPDYTYISSVNVRVVPFCVVTSLCLLVYGLTICMNKV